MCLLEEKYYKVLEGVIEEFFRAFKINLPKKNRDIIVIANDIGFEVKSAEFRSDNNDRVEGFLVVDEKSGKVDNFSKDKGIAINIDNPFRYNRFVIAYMLAHYIFEKSLQDYEKIKLSKTRLAPKVKDVTDIRKQILNYMARALLVPAKDFKKKIKRNENMNKDQFIDNMCDEYAVTRNVITQRIKEVRALNKEQ